MNHFEKWADELKTLLIQAERAGKSEQLTVRLAAMKALSQFVSDSAPNTPDILELDALASRVRTDLVLQTLDERVAAISARSGELISIQKKFGQLASDAKHRAASINLVQLRKTISTLTDTALVLKELEAALVSDEQEKLGTELTQVVNNIQVLRNRLEELM